MRKRNKHFDTWIKQVYIRVHKQFEEWFGEPKETNGLYPVVLQVDQAPFPEEHIPDGPVSWKAFENFVLPVAYEKDIDSIYLDLTEELKKRIFDTHPDKHAVVVTLRRMGVKVEDVFLDFVYDSIEVNIELGDLVKTIGVEIIPEFEDVHIKTRDPGTGPQKMDKKLIREMYTKAQARLVNVFMEQKNVEPIWIRPVKGNSKERVIVKFKDNEFEMYYKSFPDFCCTCTIMPHETVQKATSEFAKIFINSVYKHYWPEVTSFLERLK